MALVSKPNQTESAHHVSKRLTMTSAGTGYSQMHLKEYLSILNLNYSNRMLNVKNSNLLHLVKFWRIFNFN